MAKIKDPLIELLAIKLYEHDWGEWPLKKRAAKPWMKASEEDREMYRRIARGKEPLPSGEK